MLPRQDFNGPYHYCSQASDKNIAISCLCSHRSYLGIVPFPPISFEQLPKPQMPPQLLIHYVPISPTASSRTLTDAGTPAGQSWHQFLASIDEGAEAVWWAWQEDNEDNVGVFACKYVRSICVCPILVLPHRIDCVKWLKNRGRRGRRRRGEETRRRNAHNCNPSLPRRH